MGIQITPIGKWRICLDLLQTARYVSQACVDLGFNEYFGSCAGSDKNIQKYPWFVGVWFKVMDNVLFTLIAINKPKPTSVCITDRINHQYEKNLMV